MNLREGIFKILILAAFFTLNLYSSELKVVTTKKWEPFNMMVNGKLEGIGVDFWKCIAKDINVSYKFITVDKWSDVLKSIKNGKAALTVSTDVTDDRKNYAVFSKPYVSYPLVIATKNNIGFIFDIGYLKNKTIAVGKNYTAAKLMKSKYPYLNYVTVSSTDKALSLVNDGKVFAAVDILPVVAYKINKYEYNNLKISGQIPIYFKVRFMLSKKYKYLLKSINKAISAIPLEEKEKIYNKYITTVRNKRVVFSSYEILFYILIIVSFINIIFLWIYMLRKELKDLKKQKFKDLNKECDKLTGLFNRAKMKNFLKEKLENEEDFSVIMFDVKNFKEINRFYGHHFGDITLLELSSLVKSMIKNDEIFGRVKGGTFLIITGETEINACERAREIFSNVEKFEFSIVKNLQCTFVVRTVYAGENKTNEEAIMSMLENDLNKCKRKNNLFLC